MKKIKIITGLATLATAGTTLGVLASCSCSKEIVVDIEGGSYDKNLSKIELNKKSTIYVIPAKDKTIKSIKRVIVGGTTLTTNLWDWKPVGTANATKATHIVTIEAAGMTDRNIVIEPEYETEPEPGVKVSLKLDKTTMPANWSFKELLPETISTDRSILDVTLVPAGGASNKIGHFTVFHDETQVGGSSTGQSFDITQTEGTDVRITLHLSSLQEGDEITLKFVDETPVRDDRFNIDKTTNLISLTAKGLQETGNLYVPAKFVDDDGAIRQAVGIVDGGFAAAQCTSISFEPNSQFTTISNGAFKTANSLQSITLPDTTKTIGQAAFAGTPALQSISFPASTETIGAGAFEDSGLASAEFITPTGWSQIGGSAITIGTDDVGKQTNATNLKNVGTATGTNWGETGIIRSTVTPKITIDTSTLTKDISVVMQTEIEETLPTLEFDAKLLNAASYDTIEGTFKFTYTSSKGGTESVESSKATLVKTETTTGISVNFKKIFDAMATAGETTASVKMTFVESVETKSVTLTPKQSSFVELDIPLADYDEQTITNESGGTTEASWAFKAGVTIPVQKKYKFNVVTTSGTFEKIVTLETTSKAFKVEFTTDEWKKITDGASITIDPDYIDKSCQIKTTTNFDKNLSNTTLNPNPVTETDKTLYVTTHPTAEFKTGTAFLATKDAPTTKLAEARVENPAPETTFNFIMTESMWAKIGYDDELILDYKEDEAMTKEEFLKIYADYLANFEKTRIGAFSPKSIESATVNDKSVTVTELLSTSALLGTEQATIITTKENQLPFSSVISIPYFGGIPSTYIDTIISAIDNPTFSKDTTNQTITCTGTDSTTNETTFELQFNSNALITKCNNTTTKISVKYTNKLSFVSTIPTITITGAKSVLSTGYWIDSDNKVKPVMMFVPQSTEDTIDVKLNDTSLVKDQDYKIETRSNYSTITFVNYLDTYKASDTITVTITA